MSVDSVQKGHKDLWREQCSYKIKTRFEWGEKKKKGKEKKTNKQTKPLYNNCQIYCFFFPIRKPVGRKSSWQQQRQKVLSVNVEWF